MQIDGSSPRGRGTRRKILSRYVFDRFIPARAGNTPVGYLVGTDITVHPRAGGEHPMRSDTPGAASGSSPRGRGTPVADVVRSMRGRFIPARAGNTHAMKRNTKYITVHPRAGGEH